MAETVVIGIGNAFRGDDGAGLLVAQELKSILARQEGSPGPRVEVRESSGNVSELLECFGQYSTVYLVDALHTPPPEGEEHGEPEVANVLRLDPEQGLMAAAEFSGSTHILGVAQAIELARVLGGLPDKLVVYGVVGRQFEMGQAVSEPVRRAVPHVLQRIQQEMESDACTKCR